MAEAPKSTLASRRNARRLAAPARGGDHHHRADDVGAQQLDDQPGAALHRPGPQHHGRKLDLDRQRDADRPRHLAAAGGGAGRHRRLPPRLSLRAGAVLAGLDRLCLRALAALAAARAHLPGTGRCGHHGDPAGAGARDLSAQRAGPRARLQHHRGRDLAGRRPLARRGAALDHLVADPVRRLCAARHRLLRAVRALPAAHHAYPPAVRRDLGRAVGRHLRAADLRHRRHGARPSEAGDRLRARPGRRAGHAVRVAPEAARRSR